MNFTPTPYQRLLILMADISFPRSVPLRSLNTPITVNRDELSPLKLQPLPKLLDVEEVKLNGTLRQMTEESFIKRSKRSLAAQKRRVQKQRARLSNKRK